MNNKLSAKKIIAVVIAVIVIAAVIFAAINLPVYLCLKKPFNHVVKGYREADSREIVKALPEAVVDKMELTDDDYDEMDDALQESSDDILAEYLNDDDYKVSIKMLGYEKINKEQRQTLMDMYDSLEVDLDIKKAYYVDFKLNVKSPEDDLSATYGVVVGKADGEWCIVGGDMISTAVIVPSMTNYVKKSALKTANSNAKTAYNAVAEYIADRETQGYGMEESMKEIGGEIDCRGEAPANEAQRLVYDVLKDNGDKPGIAYVFKANVNGYDTYVVQWREDSDSSVIGQYPDAISWDTWEDASGKDVIWGQFKESDY